MKIVAISIFEYNAWYRFNLKTIPSDMIMNYSEQSDFSIHKVGLFEEEHDVFFVELPNEINEFRKGNIYIIPFEKLKSVIPLTRQAKAILSKRIVEITISEPVKEEIKDKIFEQRNQIFSEKGSEMMCEIFDISIKNKHYGNAFFDTLRSMKKENLLGNIIQYERLKAFPDQNIGFFYDAGSVLRQFLETEKKEKLRSLSPLSSFLEQNKNEDNVFPKFDLFYNGNDDLKELNVFLQFVDNENVNCILVIAFYFKFRYIIRNDDYSVFESEAKKYLKYDDFQKEVQIALIWISLFFGMKEFKEAYYRKKSTINQEEKNLIPSKINGDSEEENQNNEREHLKEILQKMKKKQPKSHWKVEEIMKLYDVYGKIEEAFFKDLEKTKFKSKVRELKKEISKPHINFDRYSVE